jgi:hypothetical protein
MMLHTPLTAADRRPDTAPGWVNGLDGLCLLLAGLGVCVWLFGGHREELGALRFSLRSWPRLIIAAAAVAVVRHLLFSRLPLPIRIRAAAMQARWSQAAHAAWWPFIATRPAVLAAGYFAVVTIGFIPSMVSFRVSNNELVNLAARWDAQWYLNIARDGYSWNGDPSVMQTAVFFPAMPIAMHLGAFFAGGQLVNGGLVVSLLSFLAALVYLYKLTEPLAGESHARAAVWLLAAYPFAVYFSAPYTEALFLLGSVAVFYHLGRGEWRASAMFGLLVGLARPNGFMLAVPMGLLVLQRAWRRRSLSAGETAAVLAPILGVLLFSIYLGVRVGDPLAWMKGQAAWGRGYGGFFGTIGSAGDQAGDLVRGGLYRYSVVQPFVFLHACAIILALASIWPTFRRFGAPLALFTLANLLPALISGGTMSAGRMTSALFPIFMCAGAMLPARSVPAIVAASCVMQGLIAVLFFTWRPIY